MLCYNKCQGKSGGIMKKIVYIMSTNLKLTEFFYDNIKNMNEIINQTRK